MSSGNTSRSETRSGTSPETSPTLLVDHLLASQPGKIFLIGCSSADLYWPEDRAEPRVVKRFDTLDDALGSVTLDVPVDVSTQVAVLNVGSDEATLSQQIGQAVRAFPNRLVVYTSSKAAPDTLFFAFGFRKLNVIESTSASAENRWYEFRLSHYKQAPDWLNAQFWANPERFKLDDDSDIDFDPYDTDEEE
ncbi:MAG: hypothetical protein ACI8UP_005086 [Porticoccaceae bacterium]|jgi:hypothetical protein